jgi:uncharacterized protein Usg
MTSSATTTDAQQYQLTTAEILYHLPDFPALLQSFIWQKIDLSPDFPVLRRFLDFWERNLEGKLHSVRICRASLLDPRQLRYADTEFRLH